MSQTRHRGNDKIHSAHRRLQYARFNYLLTDEISENRQECKQCFGDNVMFMYKVYNTYARSYELIVNSFYVDGRFTTARQF